MTNALRGSDKQIRWAGEIKAAAMRVIDEGLAHASLDATIAGQMRDALEQQTAAGWWIDRLAAHLDGLRVSAPIEIPDLEPQADGHRWIDSDRSAYTGKLQAAARRLYVVIRDMIETN